MRRIKWIDIAKGIGIFLVIIGHRSEIFNTTSIRIIYSFHMPLFFFLAGCVFDYNKYSNFWNLFLKKCKTLLLPYIFFYLASIGHQLFIMRGITYSDALKSCLYMLYATDNLINTPLWFMPCLFVMELGYYQLRKIFHNEKFLLISIGLCTILGGLAYKIFPVRPPMSFDVALYSLLFFYLGERLRKYDIQKITLWKRFVAFVAAGGFNLLINTKFLTTGISIPSGVTLKVFVLFYLGALSGIAFVSLLSTFLTFDKIFAFLGKISRILLATHMLLFDLMYVGAITGFVIGLNVGNKYFEALIYTVITIIMALPIWYILNNGAPFAIGKSYSKK